MLPCSNVMVAPLFSTTSISPQPGQPIELMFVPIIQRAGHIPTPAGSLARHSIRPYVVQNRPSVFIRAEVYDDELVVSCRATMWRKPPATYALFVRLV